MRCSSCHAVPLAHYKDEGAVCRFCGLPLEPIPSAVPRRVLLAVLIALLFLAVGQRYDAQRALVVDGDPRRDLWKPLGYFKAEKARVMEERQQIAREEAREAKEYAKRPRQHWPTSNVAFMQLGTAVRMGGGVTIIQNERGETKSIYYR